MIVAHRGIYARDHARLPNRTFVGTESFAQASSVMWEQVWSMRSVVGDFIWTVSSPLLLIPTKASDGGAAGWRRRSTILVTTT